MKYIEALNIGNPPVPSYIRPQLSLHSYPMSGISIYPSDRQSPRATMCSYYMTSRDAMEPPDSNRAGASRGTVSEIAKHLVGVGQFGGLVGINRQAPCTMNLQDEEIPSGCCGYQGKEASIERCVATMWLDCAY